MSLQRLNECFIELNLTNSSNEKMEILRKYDDCKNYFLYSQHPYWQYGVTSKTIQKRIPDHIVGETKYSNLFELLNALKKREITGHAALDACINFINCTIDDTSHIDLIYQILDKNIKVRMGTSLINKVWLDLIPEFDVALANKYEDYENKINFEKELWFASRKLDGVRTICRIENGIVNFYSRNGKEFFTLDRLKNSIINSELINYNIVLDGEMCIVDENDEENFSQIVGDIKRKDYTIENPKFKVFDILELNDFDIKKGRTIYSIRYQTLKDICSNISSYIDVVEQEIVKSKADLDSKRNYAAEHGWEGLILRKDVPYEGKRTKYLLKCKFFKEEDFIIKEVEIGPFRIIDKKTKLEKEIQTMTAVTILYKGNKVNVGSGWSLAERERYFNNPELLIGSTINVQYFEICKDKTGKESLRFPTKKIVYEGKRDV